MFKSNDEWYADLEYKFSVDSYRVELITLLVNPSCKNEFKVELNSATPIDLRFWRECYERAYLSFDEEFGCLILGVGNGHDASLTRSDLMEELDFLRDEGYRVQGGTPGSALEDVQKRWLDPAPFDVTTFFDVF